MKNLESKTSIEDELRKGIRKRLALSFRILLILVIIASLYEGYKRILVHQDTMRKQADTIENIIKSEILVENRTAIPFLLNNIRNKSGYKSIKFLEGRVPEVGFQYFFPFSWKYTFNVVPSNSGTMYGTVVIIGDEAENLELLKRVMLQVFFLALFFLVARSILLPLSTIIPEKYVLQPVRSLVKSFNEGNSGPSFQSRRQYIELDPAFDELEKFVRDRENMEIKKKRNQRAEAIAQTTQMLAHDVRKPFTLLIKIMDLMEGKTGEEIERMAKEFFPQVRTSLKSVKAMIRDIQEVGSDTDPVCQEVDIEEIISAAITENLKFKDHAKINL